MSVFEENLEKQIEHYCNKESINRQDFDKCIQFLRNYSTLTQTLPLSFLGKIINKLDFSLSRGISSRYHFFTICKSPLENEDPLNTSVS